MVVRLQAIYRSPFLYPGLYINLNINGIDIFLCFSFSTLCFDPEFVIYNNFRNCLNGYSTSIFPSRTRTSITSCSAFLIRPRVLDQPQVL